MAESVQEIDVREYFESIVIAVILALFIRTFVVQAFKIPTGSMENNLLIGDHLLVNKFVVRRRARRALERDAAADRHDQARRRPRLQVPDEPDRDFIKRVIGLPGETRRAAGEEGLHQRQAARRAVRALPRSRRAATRSSHEVTSFDVRERYGPVTVPPEPVFRDGRQPRQLRRTAATGASCRATTSKARRCDLLVVRSRARRLRGRMARARRSRARLGLRALLHADALGSDVPPDSLTDDQALSSSRSWRCWPTRSGASGRPIRRTTSSRTPSTEMALHSKGKTVEEMRDKVLELAASCTRSRSTPTRFGSRDDASPSSKVVQEDGARWHPASIRLAVHAASSTQMSSRPSGSAIYQPVRAVRLLPSPAPPVRIVPPLSSRTVVACRLGEPAEIGVDRRCARPRRPRAAA